MTNDPNYHWDGEKWLHWDGTAWQPVVEQAKPKVERTAFEVWGGGSWPNQNVAGESHYEAHLKAIAAKHRNAREVELPAYVVTESDNKFDANACAVYVDGGIVGYLPREDAKRYAPALAALENLGHTACRGQSRRHEREKDRPGAMGVGACRPRLCRPSYWRGIHDRTKSRVGAICRND